MSTTRTDDQHEQVARTVTQLFGGIVQAIHDSNALLHAQLVEARKRATSFHADLSGGNTLAANAGAYVTPRESKGVLRMIHNPTTSDVQVTLTDGAGGPTKFNQLLPAASTQTVYVVFKNGLYCSAGAGCTAGGRYEA